MSVDEAYADVVRITRETARNFAWGIRVLPGPKRRAVAALYAFAREVDDLADREEPARAELERKREAVEALPSSPNGDTVMIALADAMTRYGIPKQALQDLVTGALMDCDRNRYASWDELREYCRCVAGAVGVACAAVYGPTDPASAAPRAETLGLALQQINIMRDVPEDWRRTGPDWCALMDHQATRAETLMREGLELLPLLDRRSALCVRSFAGIYRGLLAQMRSRDYDVFSERPSLSAAAKVKAVATL
jgi:phytoene synthase